MGEDSSPEAGAAGDSPGGDSGNGPNQDDPHLLLYNRLSTSIRSHIDQIHRSLLSGLSVIGIIIAYALLSGEFVFLAVIPVIVGFLIVQTIHQLNNIMYHAYHLMRIEEMYVDDYPLFEWEHRFGMTGTERGVSRFGVNWTHVPQAIILVLAGLGYVGSIYIALVVWPPEGVDILLIGLTRSGLVVVYVLLTVLIGLSGYSYYLHQSDLSYPVD